MRRKDREVIDFDAIVDIINACHVLRIGLSDGRFPYIVPVNFAYQIHGRQIEFYVHGAMAGRKYELMRRNGVCSFEMDIPLRLECIPEKKDVTMRYKSVMGTARIEFLDEDEKQYAIDHIIMNRYDDTRDFAYNRAAVARTSVVKLTVVELTAKANPVDGGAD